MNYKQADRANYSTRQAIHLFSAFISMGIVRGLIMKVMQQDRLKDRLSYDPVTGIFTWIESPCPTVMKGTKAGTNENGYITIGIDNKVYKAHRLAWLYSYGYMPEQSIDHIDRNKANNKISNLREASSQCNIRNTDNWATNKSGVKGVYWHNQSGRWRAKITVNYKVKVLGNHKAFDEAVCARLAAEQCLGWSGCDSSSPAFKHVQKIIN